MSYAPKRKSISKKTRALVFEKDQGLCYLCNKPITDGLFDVDHEIARELGGADDISNYRPAHKHCHKAKTKEDVRLIAKGNRIIRKADPLTRKASRKPIPSPKEPWGKGRKLVSRKFGE